MANLDFNSDKGISNILESVHEQASIPSEYRERLLQELKHAATVMETPRPLWRMTDWAIIAAVIILTIIAYSLWLPQHVVTKLFP
jgi:hypothetical protein